MAYIGSFPDVAPTFSGYSDFQISILTVHYSKKERKFFYLNALVLLFVVFRSSYSIETGDEKSSGLMSH